MKMLRARKQFGRCSVKGHGDWCEVSRDIQETEFTRAQEKREWKKEIKEGLCYNKNVAMAHYQNN